jgi:hypothetical protein
MIITGHDGKQFLAVTVSHVPTDIYGCATRPVEECPMHLLADLAASDWSHPLLQEMRQECLWELQVKAIGARDLLAELEPLLEVPPEVLGLQPLFPTEQSA